MRTFLLSIFVALLLLAVAAIALRGDLLRSGLPVLGAAPDAAPSPEQRYADAVGDLHRRREAWFDRLVDLRVRLGEAQDRLRIAVRSREDKEEAVRRLARAADDAPAGTPVEALGRRYATADEARSTLLQWAGELEAAEGSEAVLRKACDEIAGAAQTLDGARRRLDSRLREAQSRFASRQSQLDAARVATELTALESAVHRLGAEGATADLERIFADLDHSIFTEEVRRKLHDEDLRAAQGADALGGAVQVLQDEAAKRRAEERVRRLVGTETPR